MIRNKRILLIDDNHALKFLTKMLLRDEKHVGIIDDAANGLAALEHLENPENTPDIIFLDMNMPRMNGYEFLLEYKKRGMHNTHTKVYMLTTSTLEEDRKKVLDTGIVADYFEKPLCEQHLRKIINDLLVAK